MAEKVVDKTEAVLTLSVEEGVDKKKKKQVEARSSILHLLPTVRAVILRSLLNAGIVTFFFALGAACYMLIDTIVFSHPPLAAQAPSWLLRSASAVGKTTEAEEKTETLAVVLGGMLWCAAPQAAAGVLALMLPSHRRRLRILLAFVGLLGNIVEHCLFAALVRIFIFVAADLDLAVVGLLYFRTAGTVAIVMVAVDDLLCFLGLLLRGGEE